MSFAAARCGSASRGGRGSRRAAIGRAAIGHMAIGQTSRSADQELVDSYHAIHLGETSEERSSRLDNPPDNVCDAVMRLNTGDSYLTPSVNFASQTPSFPPLLEDMLPVVVSAVVLGMPLPLGIMVIRF